MRRSEPELVLNERGKWEARWYVQTPKGWSRRRRLMGATKAEAHAAFATFLAHGEHIERRREPVKTVNDAIDRYLDERCEETGNRRSQELVLRPVRRALGNVAAGRIDHDAARDYAENRARGLYHAPGRQRRPIGASTIRRELGALQAALRYALRDVSVALPKPSASGRREVWMDEATVTRLLADLEHEDVQLRLFVKFGLLYGARRGAICGLEWEWGVDLRSGVIDFNPPGARVTRKRKPRVPIVDDIRADLVEAGEACGFAGPVVGWQAEKRFRGFMRDKGLGHITPHALKHTMVTLSLRAGVKAWDISAICATDPATLQRVYGHHDPEHAKQFVGAWRR